MSKVFKLDKAKIRESFGAASLSYDAVAALQRTIGRQLVEKARCSGLSGTILDLGCGTGYLTAELLNFQSVEHVVALDIALPMLQVTRRKLEHRQRVSYLCADAERLTLAPVSIDRIFSNLALQWCRDLASVFGDCRKILKPGGVLVLSTFGPNTLSELRQAWAAVDTYRHVNEFYDSDQLMRFLVDAGFTEIQLDVQVQQPVYDSVRDLMQELKGIGAHNVSVGRKKQMTTPSQLQRMISAYPVFADGGISATFEVITIMARC
ncbi:MAG: malonyl-ACP O-methyltransferase BioC [Gammaproteobacteria bacterium]